MPTLSLFFGIVIKMFKETVLSTEGTFFKIDPLR